MSMAAGKAGAGRAGRAVAGAGRAGGLEGRCVTQVGGSRLLARQPGSQVANAAGAAVARGASRFARYWQLLWDHMQVQVIKVQTQ